MPEDEGMPCFATYCRTKYMSPLTGAVVPPEEVKVEMISGSFSGKSGMARCLHRGCSMVSSI
jgi:hypothetical protein